LKSYVSTHHLDAAPQYSATDQFYCTAYYITLHSNREALMFGHLEEILLLFKEKIMFKKSLIKIKPESLRKMK
jgi:hypothetical protein